MVLQIVVQPDGTVGDVKVVDSLRKGLDNNAVAAVQKWKFAPATYRDQPVPVYLNIALKFQLRDAAKTDQGNFDRRQQCASNLGELRRAAQVSNAGPRPSFDLADCLMEVGREKEAIGVLQNLADFSHSPSMWNNVAYHLASHQVALDTAVKWGHEAVINQTREVRNNSHNHLNLDHLVESRRLITFWDTLGWVYFLRDDFVNAAKFLAPGFSLWQDPSLGEHLAATYEQMGKKDEAVKVYAMTIAAENRLNDTSPEMLARLKVTLSKLISDQEWSSTLKNGEANLIKVQTISVPNLSQRSGTADFLVAFTATQIKEARQVSGDDSLKPMADVLRSIPVRYEFPDHEDLIFTERGRLNCAPDAQTCNFVLISPLDAIAVTKK